MNETHLQDLARIAVKKGVNLQPGQLAVIQASTDHLPLARLVQQEAWKAGAGDVWLLLRDDLSDKIRLENGPDELFDDIPDWKAARLNEAAAKNAAFIHIDGDDPDLMSGIDPSRLTRPSLAMRKKAKPYRDGIENGTLAWTVIPAATPAWAARVYPELEEGEALETLWRDLLEICRADGNGVENWTKHNASFDRRLKKLNGARFEKLHYYGGGTDLWVDLPKEYVFQGGSTYLNNGVETDCNIPTEEVFTAPSKYGVNGTLKATMPLSWNGSLIDDFSFVFKDGKVVEYHAGVGEDILAQILSADENAAYLGEAALVDCDSMIHQKGRIFYNTLLDENAACHFAFGQSYAETLENGCQRSREDLEKAGMNQSDNHVDFMIGSPSLNIDGILPDGSVIPVFVNGHFSSWFEE